MKKLDRHLVPQRLQRHGSEQKGYQEGWVPVNLVCRSVVYPLETIRFLMVLSVHWKSLKVHVIFIVADAPSSYDGSPSKLTKAPIPQFIKK